MNEFLNNIEPSFLLVRAKEILEHLYSFGYTIGEIELVIEVLKHVLAVSQRSKI